MKTLRNYTVIYTMLLMACSGTQPNTHMTKDNNQPTSTNTLLDTATFGAGCFWCVEAVFQQVKGVHKVVSGYMGGSIKNPTYREICSGLTGHAEVCQITYDPTVVKFEDLLQVFWLTHDPTTLNRQGNDIGTQYRSVVFYHNAQQQEIAQSIKQQLDKSGAWSAPIVTEITQASTFYPAEDYHQNYFNQNSEQPYCQFVIKPKLEKFNKVFADKKK